MKTAYILIMLGITVTFIVISAVGYLAARQPKGEQDPIPAKSFVLFKKPMVLFSVSLITIVYVIFAMILFPANYSDVVASSRTQTTRDNYRFEYNSDGTIRHDRDGNPVIRYDVGSETTRRYAKNWDEAMTTGRLFGYFYIPLMLMGITAVGIQTSMIGKPGTKSGKILAKCIPAVTISLAAVVCVGAFPAMMGPTRALQQERQERQFLAEEAAREELEQHFAETAQQPVVIDAGDSLTVGLKSDGSVMAAGKMQNPQDGGISGFSDVIAVAVGCSNLVGMTRYDSIFGLRTDGTVMVLEAEKSGSSSSFITEVSSWSNIVAISAGGQHVVGLKADGTVVMEGPGITGKRWENIAAISAGEGGFTAALTADGTILLHGSNQGWLDVADWKDMVAVAAGGNATDERFVVGLVSDGTVLATGRDPKNRGYHDVENWTDIVAISAGVYHIVGLRADGTVVAVGSNDNGQLDVENWRDIVAIAAGEDHTVGVKSDGTAVAVGKNYDGQCDVEGWSDIIVD